MNLIYLPMHIFPKRSSLTHVCKGREPLSEKTKVWIKKRNMFDNFQQIYLSKWSDNNAHLEIFSKEGNKDVIKVNQMMSYTSHCTLTRKEKVGQK